MRTQLRAAAGHVRRHSRVAGVGLLVLTSGLAGLALPHAASAVSAETVPPASSAAAWLAAQFDPGTSLIPSAFVPGAADGVGSAYAATALRLVGGHDRVAIAAVDALSRIADITIVDSTGNDLPGSISRLILAAVAVGENPRSFGGIDLVARLEATMQTSGPNAGRFGVQDALYDGAFRQGLSLAALSMVTPRPTSIDTGSGPIEDVSAVAWLRSQQCADGSWMPSRSDLGNVCAFDPATFSGPDTNSTAMASIGLRSVGSSSLADPLRWLNSVRNPDGGWSFDGQSGSSTDPNSTGLVMAALRALGQPVDGAATSALIGFQIGGDAPPAEQGSFYFPFGDIVPNLAATNDAVLGLTTSVWPKALTEQPLDTSTTTTAAPTTTTIAGSTTTTVAPATTVASVASTSTSTASPTPASPTPGSEAPAAVADESLSRTGSQSSASLATTGADASSAVTWSIVLLAAGAVMLAGARRRAHRGIG